jgi:hypothetical protein
MKKKSYQRNITRILLRTLLSSGTLLHLLILLEETFSAHDASERESNFGLKKVAKFTSNNQLKVIKSIYL